MKKTLKRIKTGALERGFSLAKTTLGMGARAAGHTLSHLLSDSETKAEALKSLLIDQAKLFTEELSQLKGSLMKVGQNLSVLGEYFLPPEVNQVFKSLQQESVPLDWEEMQKTVKRRLSPEQLAQLEIEPEALASASLGQVHLATRKSDGKKLALKIQYPGVDKAIDGDLKTIRRMMSMAKITRHSKRMDQLFSEVRQMLHQEVDYERELKLTLGYQRVVEGDPRYVLPQVLPEFSNCRILTTVYIEALPVDHPRVLALSQERRDALGLAFFELYLKEFYQQGMVQTDPHFGNYRVLLAEKEGEPDRLVLLDFGAVRIFPDTFRKPYREMVKALLRNDDAAAIDFATEIRFLDQDDKESLKQDFVRLSHLFMEPFRRVPEYQGPQNLMDSEGRYDWSASDLPKRIAKDGASLVMSFRLRPPPREIVFLDRKLSGVYIFLSVLKCRLSTRDLLEKYL